MLSNELLGTAVHGCRVATAEGHIDEHTLWAVTSLTIGNDEIQAGEDAGDGTCAAGTKDLDADEFGAL